MLLANGVRAGGGPYRFNGGNGALAVDRTRAATAALALGFNIGAATVVSGVSIANLNGIPSGTKKGWVMPVKAGAIKSYRLAEIAVSGAATGEKGLARTATTTITFDGTAVGGLIAGATGTATISIDGTAAIVASLNATGTVTIAVDASAALGAIASLTGTGTVDVSGSAEIMGLGTMTGTTVETGALTPEAIAVKVWEYLIGGSEAQDLLAGAAGDPLLGTVEGALTLREVQRIMLAALAGTSERAGSTITFTSPVDGTTVRITGSFDAENNRTGVILDGD